MLDTKPLQQTIKVILPATEHGGLNRVLAAAVINPRFRCLLLQNPSQTILSGFQGETFELTTEEAALLLSIRADSLTDLAQQLACGFGKFPQPTSRIPASPFEFYG